MIASRQVSPPASLDFVSMPPGCKLRKRQTVGEPTPRGWMFRLGCRVGSRCRTAARNTPYGRSEPSRPVATCSGPPSLLAWYDTVWGLLSRGSFSPGEIMVTSRYIDMCASGGEHRLRHHER